MKSKRTDSLKPLLTKKLSEVGHSKLNEVPGNSECLRQNFSSWIFEVKQYQEATANKQSQNGRGGCQIDEITYTKGGLLLMFESRKLSILRSKLWISQI